MSEAPFQSPSASTGATPLVPSADGDEVLLSSILKKKSKAPMSNKI